MSLPNLLYLSSACTFRAAVCAKRFSKDCTLRPHYVRDSAIFAEVNLEPLNSAYFLGAIPLVPPLQNFKKRPIWVSLRNLLYLSSACTFRAAVCAKRFSKDCTLSPNYLVDSAIYAEVIIEPLKSAYFLGAFPLVPPLQNFKKRPIWVSLPNLLYLSSACTFKAAVCAKKFIQALHFKPILSSR